MEKDVVRNEPPPLQLPVSTQEGTPLPSPPAGNGPAAAAPAAMGLIFRRRPTFCSGGGGSDPPTLFLRIRECTSQLPALAQWALPV